jgi:hypothetical protein
LFAKYGTFSLDRYIFVILEYPEFTGFIAAKETFLPFGNVIAAARAFPANLARLPVGRE